MTKLTSLAAAGALLAAVVVAGCGSRDDHDMGAMSSPAPAPTSSATATPATGEHDDADVMFAQMMIPHHRQAIEMADMIIAKQGVKSDVTTLATQIKAAQGPEIDQMTGWLAGWGQSASSMPMDHGMAGTMSQADMDALDEATGDRAARLFLSGMVGHHRGAIAMAEDELADGQNPEARRLAQSIKDSQQTEIDTMNELLTTY